MSKVRRGTLSPDDRAGASVQGRWVVYQRLLQQRQSDCGIGRFGSGCGIETGRGIRCGVRRDNRGDKERGCPCRIPCRIDSASSRCLDDTRLNASSSKMWPGNSAPHTNSPYLYSLSYPAALPRCKRLHRSGKLSWTSWGYAVFTGRISSTSTHCVG